MRRFRSLLIGLTLIVCLAADTFAQQGVVSIDPKGCGIFNVDTVLAGDKVRFLIHYKNNTSARVNVSNGFRVSSYDGAVWDSLRASGLGTVSWLYDSSQYPPIIDTIAQYSWFQAYFDISFGILPNPTPVHRSLPYANNTIVGLVGFGLSPNALPVTYDDSAWAITLYFHDKSQAGKHLCIDTSFFSFGGAWKWSGVDNFQEYKPAFQGISPSQLRHSNDGYCFLIYDLPCIQLTATEQTAKASPTCAACSCCFGTTGNVNMTGGVDAADLSSLVSYLTGGTFVPPCMAAANVNGAGGVDASDLSSLVNFMTGGTFVLPECQ